MTDKTSDLMEKLQSTENTAELDKYLEEIRDKYPKDLSSYIKAILAEKGMSTADIEAAVEAAIMKTMATGAIRAYLVRNDLTEIDNQDARFKDIFTL